MSKCNCHYLEKEKRWVLCPEGKRLHNGGSFKTFEDMQKYWEHLNKRKDYLVKKPSKTKKLKL